MKTLNLSYEAVLWQHSWINLIMLMAPFAGNGEGADSKEDRGKDLSPLDLFNMI